MVPEGMLFVPFWSESKAPMSQLVNAEVNSGNRKAVLASNYATRICGGHNCGMRYV